MNVLSVPVLTVLEGVLSDAEADDILVGVEVLKDVDI